MPATDNQGQNVDLLEVKKNAGETDEQAMKRWYKDVFLCVDFRQQQDFIKRFAEKNPGFLQMFEELRSSFVFNIDSRSDNFHTQKERIRQEVRDGVMQILDIPESRTRFFQNEQVKKFTAENWDYYGERLLGGEGKRILAKAKNFATSINIDTFNKLEPKEQLRQFVATIGTDILKLVDGGKGKSIHGKVFFLEAFIQQNMKDGEKFSLTKVLAVGVPENVDTLVDRARVLSDAVYIDAKDKKHYEAGRNPDGFPETPVEQTASYKKWREAMVKKLLETPQAKQANITSEDTFKQMKHEDFKALLKKVYPYIQVNFPLITAKTLEAQNEAILVEAFKVLKYQDEVERSERLALPENQAVLSQYNWVLTEKNALSGYYGAAFEDAQGNIIIASRGTGSILPFNPDIANDLILAAKGVPPQKDDLQKLINRVAEKYGESLGNRQVIITGHSLGGALSEFASTNVIKIPPQMKNVTTLNFNGPGVLTNDRREERQNITILTQDIIGDAGARHAGIIGSVPTVEQGLFAPHFMENVSKGYAAGKTTYINMSAIREALEAVPVG